MAEGWRVRRRLSWILTAWVFLAFALRLYRLDFLSLRGDESFTMLFVSNPLPQLLEGIRTVEPNPPLYYFLLRGALAIWGRSDFAGRYLSALFGVLAVPWIYRLGRVLIRDRKLGASAGLLAGFLWAINPYQIWHGQDVRNYTLWPALSLASLCFMVRALQENRKRWWLAYGVTALLSLYTHYYDLFVLLAENILVVLLYHGDRDRFRRWLGIQGALAVLYLPWPLLASSRPFTYQDATAEVPGVLGIFARTLSTFTLGETIESQIALVLLPALALLLIVGLGFSFWQDRGTFLFLLLYLAVPSLGLLLLAQWRPLFRERYLNVIAPGYSLTLALGLLALARLRRGAVVATAAALGVLIVPAGVSLGHYYFDRHYAKSADWRGLAAYLEAHAGADDVIVENYPDPTLAYYYQGPARRVVLPHRSAVDQVGPLPVNRVAAGNTLRELLAQHRRLWLIPYRSDWDPQGFVEGWLNRRARKVQEDQVDVFRVVAYEAGASPQPTIPFPFRSRLGQEIELLGYDLQAEPGCREKFLAPRMAGEEPQAQVWTRPIPCALHLTLYWKDLAPLDVDYTVFTHLLDPGGQIQAQQDNQPQGGNFPTLEWLPGDLIVDEYRLELLPEAPPGVYTLEIGMYCLETGERLAAYAEDGRRWPDDAIRLPVELEMVP